MEDNPINQEVKEIEEERTYLKDILKKKAVSWESVPNEDIIKSGIEEKAAQHRLNLGLIPFPFDPNYVPHEAFQTILNDLFTRQSDSNGLNSSIFISKGSSLIVKQITLNCANEESFRDKLLELRNLLLIKREVQLFEETKVLLERIRDQPLIELQDLVALKGVLDEMILRHDAFKIVETGHKSSQWVFDYIKKLIIFAIDNPAVLGFEKRVQNLKDETIKLLNGFYGFHSRIIFGEFFSIKKEESGGPTIWHIYIVSDYITPVGPGGEKGASDLKTFLEQKYPGQIPENVALDVIRQMASLVTFLHGINYTHGDLKLDNFFVKYDPEDVNQLQVFLGDLGQSRLGDYTKTNRGYDPFKAPEFGSGRTMATDVFAFGLTMMQVVAREKMNIFITYDEENRKRVLSSKNIHNFIPDNIHDNLKVVIRGCLESRSVERWMAWEALINIMEIVPREGVSFRSHGSAPLPGKYVPHSVAKKCGDRAQKLSLYLTSSSSSSLPSSSSSSSSSSSLSGSFDSFVPSVPLPSPQGSKPNYTTSSP